MIRYNFYRNVFNRSKLLCKLTTNLKVVSRHCSVRRAVLNVPGSDENELKKAFTLKVDCIVMNCEVGVHLHEKEEARQNIKKLLDEGPVTENDPEWSVQVNAVQTPELCEADLSVLLSATYLPISICLPKVNSVDQLQWFAEKVWSALMKRPEESRGPIKLIMVIESAMAILNLPELCKKAIELSTMAPIIPDGLILASQFLLADLGAQRTPSNIELLYAREKLVLVAKAFGLQAIDMAFLNTSDMQKLIESCKDGAILGYTGKQVIHSSQVPVAQEIFSPSRSRVQWAKKIVKTFKQKEEMGALENLTEMATVKKAQNVICTAKAARKFQDSDTKSLELQQND